MGTVFILLALVADGLDGRSARFFGVSSEIGKEMDSLCDLVSFGVAPAFLAYSYCLQDYGYFGWAIAILFALCGAWRLARFNVNVSVVHGFFMGLAIPAGGCLVATSIWLLRMLDVPAYSLGPSFPVIMAIVAYLMVSPVHYPDFKGKGERFGIVPKVCALLLFLWVLYVGRTSLLPAVLCAIFAAYASFGVVQHLVRFVMPQRKA